MVELPDLSGMNFRSESVSQVVSGLYPVFKTIIALGVLGFVIWYVLNVMKVLKPKIKILIKEPSKVKFDIGRKIVVDGITKLKLMKEKHSIPYPNPQQIYTTGRTDFYMLRKIAEGQYLPMYFTNPSDEIAFLSESTKSWAISELVEAYNIHMKKQGIWEKYQVLISFALLAAVFLVMVLFSLGYMEHVISAFQSLANKIPVGGQAIS